MTKQLAILAFATMTLLGACKSSDFGKLAEGGMLLAGEDPEKAAKIGKSAEGFTGSLGPMPLKTELAIGGGIAVKSFTERGPLYPDQALQDYVNNIGKTIVAQTEREEYPWAFAVIENDNVNAWAAPGGYVFLTSGAIKGMQDESELAGVIAHEIAHVTKGHMVDMMNKSQRLQSISQGVQAGLEKDMPALTQSIDAANDIIFVKGLDRNMEFDADSAGAEFAALAGYDPEGLVRYLTRLSEGKSLGGGGWLTSTHPPASERIKKLRAQYVSEFDGIEGAKAADRFARMTKNL